VIRCPLFNYISKCLVNICALHRDSRVDTTGIVAGMGSFLFFPELWNLQNYFCCGGYSSSDCIRPHGFLSIFVHDTLRRLRDSPHIRVTWAVLKSFSTHSEPVQISLYSIRVYMYMYVYNREIYLCHYEVSGCHINELSLDEPKLYSRSRISKQLFVSVYRVHSVSIYNSSVRTCEV
jgi:hypothetical protein